MARNKDKKKTTRGAARPKLTRAEAEALRDKKERRAKIFVLVFVCVLIASILAIVTVGVVNAVLDAEMLDVYKDRLTKYIKISPDDYKNYPVEIKIDPVDDVAVESAYAQALYKLKTADPELKAVRYPTADGLPRAISIGDNVSMRYIGYLIEDGVRVYFNGGCNFASSSLTELGIGSGQFINGKQGELHGCCRRRVLRCNLGRRLLRFPYRKDARAEDGCER